MKLSHSLLIHATDKQLREIGVTRTHNSGWLRSALKADFTPDQVIAFEAADTRTTINRRIERVEELRKEAHPARGIICPFCSEDDFDLIGLKSHLLNYCDAFSATKDAQSDVREKVLAHRAQSAEDFANSLYEESGRNLE